ncbi:hypothetical protein GCM10027521_14250 [Amycolatopsis cihanbeyliensis]
MDPLTELLGGVRARAALITRTALTPGWSVRFASGAQLTLVSILRGRAWIVARDEIRPITPGEVAVVRGPEPYAVADDPSAPPERVVTREDYCERTRAQGRDARTCGDAGSGTALLLSGAYEGRAGISERLLEALLAVLVVRDSECPYPMLGQVAEEVVRDRPGQQAVLDRLLDLALVSTLRAWFDRQGTDVPLWYRPTEDPVVAGALRLLRDVPAHRGRSRSWPPGQVSPGRPWRGASPPRSASHRWPISRPGASPWPRNICVRPTRRSVRLPAKWVTPTLSLSAWRSSANAG